MDKDSLILQRSVSAEILIIFLLSILAGLMYNTFSGTGIPIFYHAIESTPDQQITLSQLEQIIADKRALLIDARTGEEYAAGHLPGAIHIPGYAAIDQITEAMKDISKNRQIVVYCSNIECSLAARIAGFLRFQEFSSVYVFAGGTDEWIGAGNSLIR